LISGYLKNIGWNVKESIGRTGVIADFGPSDKGIIGLRVDMDALPIFEETELSFSSQFSFNELNDDLEVKIFLSYYSFLIGSFRVSQAFCIARNRSFFPPASG